MTDTNKQVTKARAPADADNRLVAMMAGRFGVEPEKFLATLKATAFRQKEGVEISNAQMMVLLVVANEYKLNPFTKEIFAFPDKQNGIVPVVGVDGWSRIINEHPQMDGLEFRYSETIVTDPSTDEKKPKHKPCPEWCEAIIGRTDRSRPTPVREYFDEVYREPFRDHDKKYWIGGPWQSHTKRMLRHKAIIQAARIVFGFSGIYDEDEARNIIQGEVITDSAPPPAERKALAMQEAAEAAAKASSDADEKVKAEAKPEDEAPKEEKQATPEDQANVDEFFREASPPDDQAA